MEHRLKVRLTGAAILVALVVLLVPEMFRGERVRSPPANTGADGPPVRAYTIELNEHASAPLQAATAPADAAPPAASAAATPSAYPAPEPPAAPSPGPEPGTATSAPASSASHPADTSAAHPPVPVHEAASHETRAGRWTVQLGLFAKHDNAERLAQAAHAKGFAVEVSSPDAHGLYHVHSALVGDRSRALALQQQLKAQGFAASVTPP